MASTYPCGSDRVKYISYSPTHSARKPWRVCVPWLVRAFWTLLFPGFLPSCAPFVQANRKFGEPTLEAAKQRLTWIYTARLFFSYSVLCRPCSDCFWTGARSQYHPYAGAGTWDVTRNKVVPAGPCAPSRPDLRSIPSSLTFRFACRPGISCDASCSSCDAGGSSSCASFCWRRPPCEFQPSLWSIHLSWFDRSVLAALFAFYASGTPPAGPAGEGRFFSFEFPPPLRSTFVDLTGTPELALREGSYNPNGLKFGLSYLLWQVLLSRLALRPLPALRLLVRKINVSKFVNLVLYFSF